MSVPRPVIERRSTWRVRLLAALALLVGGAAAYDIGGRLLDLPRLVIGGQLDLAREAIELRRHNESLRSRVELLETTREIERQAHQLVEGSLHRLQDELLRTEQELQFLRGLVDVDTAPGLSIQRLHVLELAPEQYLVRLLLVQPITREQRVEGAVEVRLHARRGDEPVELALPELAAGGGRLEAFSFRYFEELAQELEVPAGLAPQRLEIVLRPSGDEREPLRESFDWEAALRREGA